MGLNSVFKGLIFVSYGRDYSKRHTIMAYGKVETYPRIKYWSTERRRVDN
jgi:hypothetical protein